MLPQTPKNGSSRASSNLPCALRKGEGVCELTHAEGGK